MTLSHGPLGQSVAYASQYDPSLLFPIARSHNRAALDLHAGVPALRRRRPVERL